MSTTPKKGAAKPTKRLRYGDGRAAFLGLADRVQTWVSSGRTMKAFYDQHPDAQVMSYTQFTRHTNAFIGPSKRLRRSPNALTEVTAAAAPAGRPDTANRSAGSAKPNARSVEPARVHSVSSVDPSRLPGFIHSATGGAVDVDDLV